MEISNINPADSDFAIRAFQNISLLSLSPPPQLLIQLETSATALTCVQAAVDPLIYTLVTRQFRSELGKILSSIPGCPPKSCRCNP